MGQAAAKSNPSTYDVIGVGYANRRVPDPPVAARILSAIGDARRVCNIGAGAGSYEPTDRELVAVEPSRAMIAQRRHRRRLIRACAEALPFRDDSFDAAMALLTVHHWQDVARGIAEMRRVAPLRVVFTFDPARQAEFWLVRDYLPEIQDLENGRAPSIETLSELLGGAEVRPVPVPWDCTDGFQAAHWRRPEAYLDPTTRASISTMAMLPQDLVERAIERLAADLASGRWRERNRELLDREEMDYSYRLLISHN